MTEYPLLIDLMEETGVSYRQADHWCANGYVTVEWYRRDAGYSIPASKGMGSGKIRRLAPEEARVFRIMAKLVAAGFPPKTASSIARLGEPPWELTPGVTLILEDSRV